MIIVVRIVYVRNIYAIIPYIVDINIRVLVCIFGLDVNV